jgi:hypothetical protein
MPTPRTAKILGGVLHTPGTKLHLVSSFIVLIVVLLLITNATLIISVAEGHLPFLYLISVTPLLIADFFTAEDFLTLHYILFSLLASFYYVTMRAILISKSFPDTKSFVLGALGVVGISIGVSCISCGLLAGYLLLSTSSAVVAGVILFANTPTLFLFGAHLSLAIALVSALYSYKKFVAR